jgi:hypothetical protein
MRKKAKIKMIGSRMLMSFTVMLNDYQPAGINHCPQTIMLILKEKPAPIRHQQMKVSCFSVMTLPVNDTIHRNAN